MSRTALDDLLLAADQGVMEAEARRKRVADLMTAHAGQAAMETILLESEQARATAESRVDELTDQLAIEKGTHAATREALRLATEPIATLRADLAKCQQGEKVALQRASAAEARAAVLADELKANRTVAPPRAVPPTTEITYRSVVREHDANGKPFVIDTKVLKQ